MKKEGQKYMTKSLERPNFQNVLKLANSFFDIKGDISNWLAQVMLYF